MKTFALYLVWILVVLIEFATKDTKVSYLGSLIMGIYVGILIGLVD